MDAGHGWVEVPRSELVELGIIGKISKYSYQRGDKVYLEEDCDASTFVTAFTAKHGNPPEFVDDYSHMSPVRDYAHFRLCMGS